MAEDVTTVVRNFTSCAKNRVRLLNITNKIQLFPATEPLFSAGIDIVGTLTKANRFSLVIFDRFKKLTQDIPLRRIDALTTAVSFTEKRVLRYVVTNTMLSDNGS